MKWYIEKVRIYPSPNWSIGSLLIDLYQGKPISEDKPIRMSWSRNLPKVSCGEKLKQVTTSLYMCNLDDAPDHLTEGMMQ
jgi:hypothetical protein